MPFLAAVPAPPPNHCLHLIILFDWLPLLECDAARRAVGKRLDYLPKQRCRSPRFVRGYHLPRRKRDTTPVLAKKFLMNVCRGCMLVRLLDILPCGGACDPLLLFFSSL